MEMTYLKLCKIANFVEWCLENKHDENDFYKTTLMNIERYMSIVICIKEITRDGMEKIQVPYQILMDVQSIHSEHWGEYVFAGGDK